MRPLPGPSPKRSKPEVWGRTRLVSIGKIDSDPEGDWVVLPADGRGKLLSSVQLRLDGGMDPVSYGKGVGLRFRSWSEAWAAIQAMGLRDSKLDWRPKGKGGKL